MDKTNFLAALLFLHFPRLLREWRLEEITCNTRCLLTLTSRNFVMSALTKTKKVLDKLAVVNYIKNRIP
ncbi:hypothetical protein AMJ44_15795 [candidate division WOR-1 bacterium DG_54_3]|uniref:Uncharacterized protein n=1 Tax=candidate division WOR-1 bacterium DG_54_3 TaxID=1703775 RepID=A0A0S7XIK1_UNCSA|nr:MAG: hypothetical protein AMJ44_15795 [candidate division WOR-1 bacterium DG_54_3]